MRRKFPCLLLPWAADATAVKNGGPQKLQLRILFIMLPASLGQVAGPIQAQEDCEWEVL